jgi:hypothetical protein
MVVNGLLGICSGGKNFSILAEFCVWGGEGCGQNYNEIVYASDLRLT